MKKIQVLDYKIALNIDIFCIIYIMPTEFMVIIAVYVSLNLKWLAEHGV